MPIDEIREDFRRGGRGTLDKNRPWDSLVCQSTQVGAEGVEQWDSRDPCSVLLDGVWGMICGETVDGSRDETLSKGRSISPGAKRRIHLEPASTLELISVFDVKGEMMGGYLGGDALTIAASLFDQCQSIGGGEVGDMGMNLQPMARLEYRADRFHFRLGRSSLLMSGPIGVTSQDGRIFGVEHHHLASKRREHLLDG